MPPRDHYSSDLRDVADTWRRPAGIYLVLPLEGSLAETVREVQQRYDPKLAAQMPPHLTLVGSSGMGPIDGKTSEAVLREALEPITSSTPPLSLAVGAPMRFMQSDIVVLPLDPHGAMRELHERIRASGVRYASPRFTFTPHITLSFYRELTDEARRALLSVRANEPAHFSRLIASLTDDPGPPREVLELPFGGEAGVTDLDDVLAEVARDASYEAGEAVARLVAEYFRHAHAGEGPVSTAYTATELAERFDEAMPARGVPLDQLLVRVRDDVLPDANRLAHPMAMGHQVSAPLPVAVWIESLTAALNQSIAVSEMSPTLTAVERRVVRWLCDLAGLGASAGGTLTTGGTEATFTALLAARGAVLPDAWAEGVGGGGPAPVVVCGEHAHYAVTRAAGELGLGMRNVVVVPSLDWRMDSAALDETLAGLERQGRTVMAVVATAGSTPTGSFDDLEAIGQQCEARGLWLHVDAAHGAPALLSPAHRHRMRGISRARTLTWDPHKMMLLPLQAGVLLARDERDLDVAFAQRAPYLFQGNDGGGTVDQGVRSFLCSRRADALKLWVALLRHGAVGMAALYDRLCASTMALWSRIGERDDVVALHQPECNILCFRWIGDRSLDDARLDEVNAITRETYNRSGHGWITSTLLGGRRVLRVTVMNPLTGPVHVERMLDEVCNVAAKTAAGIAMG